MTMTRPLTRLTTVLLAPLAALHAADAPRQKPDIVFILADDLGYADVGFNGPDIKTPSIDKLRAAGAKLESFYTLQVCTPSRCALRADDGSLPDPLWQAIQRAAARFSGRAVAGRAVVAAGVARGGLHHGARR
jgi:hypothetical protein